MLFQYQVKDYHREDEWSLIDYYEEEAAAKVVASDWYYDGPCDADQFRCEIKFKSGNVYIVTAQQDEISFFVNAKEDK